MIGRELGDQKHIKWMSCANKGKTIEINLFYQAKETVNCSGNSFP
jgi:hypothetical protein